MGTSPDPNKQRDHCQRHAKSIAADAERMRKALQALKGFADDWPERVANEIIVQLLAGISIRSQVVADLLDCLEHDLAFVRFGQTNPEAANDGD